MSATITYELHTTNFAVSKWMIFLPEPPELPSQTKVKTTAEPVGKLVTEKSPLGRTVRYAEIVVDAPKAGAGASMKLEVEAVLRSRKLVPLTANESPPDVAPLTAAERKYYLSATAQIDHESKAVRDWLGAKKLQRARDESELDFAARVLGAIRADVRYHHDPEDDKRASVVCQTLATDCGGMSYLFAAALRANDVPARVLVGRLARPPRPGSRSPEPEYLRAHVRAELFVAGTGWVPVDPALAQGGRAPVRAFIGSDPGDFLVLHVDPDLKLPFPDREREAPLLQLGPAYWTVGRGKFDGTFGSGGWDLKATPIKK